LCYLIEKSNALKLLNLENAQINDTMALKLANALNKSAAVQSLHLSGNPITQTCVN